MFKSLKLGAKIGVGFGILITLALLLGGLAVWKMTSVQKDATTMATINVPAANLAGSIASDAQSTMYKLRGYVYSDDPKFLADGRKSLEEVKKDLKDGPREIGRRRRGQGHGVRAAPQ
jgi:methyl-accepting chemotaxis protein